MSENTGPEGADFIKLSLWLKFFRNKAAPENQPPLCRWRWQSGWIMHEIYLLPLIMMRWWEKERERDVMWPQDVFFFLIYWFLCSAQDTGSRVKVFREVKSFWLLLNLKAQFRQRMKFLSFTHPRVFWSNMRVRKWQNIHFWLITQLLQNWQGYNLLTYIKTQVSSDDFRQYE